MTPESITFLKLLLDTPGPSSFEAAPGRVWRAEAGKFAQSVHADVAGNSFATLEGGGSPRVMLAGHIDEIGVMVTHIDDDGFLSFDTIGGWDHQVFVGQRVLLLGRHGQVVGLVGKTSGSTSAPCLGSKQARASESATRECCQPGCWSSLTGDW
jgi:putative aminopeptidase FrvX